MGEIVKSVLGGAWSLVAGWFLPSALVLVLFGIFVMPSLDRFAVLSEIQKSTAGTKTIILVVTAVVIGLVLSALQTQLYRVLEGYLLWPPPLKAARTLRHQKRLRQLRERYDSKELTGLAQAALQEAYRRYPPNQEQVAPTKLGNSIRSFEYYGQDHYRLDSQVLWYQLRAVTPEAINKEADDARTGVDFFVCLVYMLGLLAATALIAVFIKHPDPPWIRLLLTALISGAASVSCYHFAVLATDSWAAAVRSMVDLGRRPLAQAYGLTLPTSLVDEQVMWECLSWFVGHPYGTVDANFDRWRRE